ncbi:acyl-CoA thioesterase [Actinokineospora sp. NPDC004072]
MRVVETDLQPKTMNSSRCELSRVVWRADQNMFGSGRGTLVLELVDDVAWATAARHADGHAVTVTVEHMIFKNPTWAGDVVTAFAQVEGTGRTSMDIGVYVTAQRGAGERVAVAEAHLVFVAVDADGNPRAVPGVYPETEAEYAAARAVEIRREHRKALSGALEQER